MTNTVAYYRTAVKSFKVEDPEKNKKVGDQNSRDSSNRLEHKMDLFLLRGSTLLFNNLFCPPLSATFEHCNISALEFFLALPTLGTFRLWYWKRMVIDDLWALLASRTENSVHYKLSTLQRLSTAHFGHCTLWALHTLGTANCATFLSSCVSNVCYYLCNIMELYTII